MTTIHPTVLTAALSLVRQSEWGLRGNIVDLVRLLTVDSGHDWAQLSQRDVADWLDTHPRHARRLLDALVVEHRVLVREPGAGNQAARYRVEPEPSRWRHVPWRIDGGEGGRPPELVRRRVADAACCAPPVRHSEPFVARYSALQTPFAARQERAANA